MLLLHTDHIGLDKAWAYTWRRVAKRPTCGLGPKATGGCAVGRRPALEEVGQSRTQGEAGPVECLASHWRTHGEAQEAGY